jgi:hypothetical protein
MIAAAAAWLAIGLGVNVLVAWGAAVINQRLCYEEMVRTMGDYPTDFPPGTWLKPPETSWPIRVPRDWPERPGAVAKIQQRAWTNTFAMFDFSDRSPEYCFASLDEYGWPLRSVGNWSCFSSKAPSRKSEFGGQIPLPEAARRKGVSGLPIRPSWPGLIVNTLLYAAIAWGMWQIPLALRRRRRCRAGRCARCGYDLAGLAAGTVCPECGGATVR